MNDQSAIGAGAAMDRRVERPGARRRRRLARIAGAAAAVALAVLVYALLPASGSLAVDAAAIQTGAVVRAPFRDYVPLRAEVARCAPSTSSRSAEGRSPG